MRIHMHELVINKFNIVISTKYLTKNEIILKIMQTILCEGQKPIVDLFIYTCMIFKENILN